MVELKQLARHPDFRAGHATQTDSLANLAFVLVAPSTVNVSAGKEDAM